MAIPPVTTNSLLNLPAPISPGTLLAKPVALPEQMGVDFQRLSGMPGYAPAYQPGSPYSATNLPEFMKDYQQTPSGKFVMSQGVLGLPPQIDNVQSLLSQGYAQEYQPLETQFQESFAFDPSMFGDMYRAGQLVPSITMPNIEPTDGLNPALAIAGAGAINKLYPYAEDLFNIVTDPLAEEIKRAGESLGQSFEAGVTQPIKETIIDPITGIAKEIYTEQKEAVRDDFGLRKAEEWTKEKLDAFNEWAEKTFDKPEFINSLQEKLKTYTGELQGSGIVDALSGGGKAIGNLQNFIENPTALNAYDAIDTIDRLNSILPENMQFTIPENVSDTAGSVGGALSIGRALEDPTTQNIANAYAGIDELMFYADKAGILDLAIDPVTGTVLPGAETVGTVATIINGIKAAEGGIDSAGEAVAVASAAAAAAAWATTGATAGTALAISNAAAWVNPYLAAIAAAISLEEALAEDMSVKDVLQSLPEVGRWFGGGGATFGQATLGYNGNDFGFVKESSKNKGWTYTMPEMHATNLILNELTDNLGFEVDRNKLKNVNTTIDIDNGRPVRAANDIVLDMINTGAIKPTANTPNNIDWGNLFTEARKYSSGYTGQKTPGSSLSGIKDLQSSPSVAAAQAYKTTIPVKYRAGKGYGTVQTPGIISKTGNTVYAANLTDASYAKFANQDDAYAFASNPENIKKKQLPPTGTKGKTTGRNRYTPGLVEVTYLEVQPDNSLRQRTKKMTQSAAQSFAVSKPAPPPRYTSPMDLGFLNIDFSKLNLGSFLG